MCDCVCVSWAATTPARTSKIRPNQKLRERRSYALCPGRTPDEGTAALQRLPQSCMQCQRQRQQSCSLGARATKSTVPLVHSLLGTYYCTLPRLPFQLSVRSIPSRAIEPVQPQSLSTQTLLDQARDPDQESNPRVSRPPLFPGSRFESSHSGHVRLHFLCAHVTLSRFIRFAGLLFPPLRVR